MNVNLHAAVDEANKCIKRQKTCASKSDAIINSIISLVTAAQKELENGAEGSDPEATLTRLLESIEDAGLFKELNSTTKDFHTSIAKLGKVGVIARPVSLGFSPHPRLHAREVDAITHAQIEGQLRQPAPLWVTLEVLSQRPASNSTPHHAPPWSLPSSHPSLHTSRTSLHAGADAGEGLRHGRGRLPCAAALTCAEQRPGSTGSLGGRALLPRGPLRARRRAGGGGGPNGRRDAAGALRRHARCTGAGRGAGACSGRCNSCKGSSTPCCATVEVGGPWTADNDRGQLELSPACRVSCHRVFRGLHGWSQQP